MMEFEKSVEKLLKVFKLENPRNYQRKALQALVNEQDVLVCHPTGTWKSIIFQGFTFFLYQEKIISLVISPLVALMKDQVNALKRYGIEATCLRSDKNLDLQVRVIRIDFRNEWTELFDFCKTNSNYKCWMIKFAEIISIRIILIQTSQL